MKYTIIQIEKQREFISVEGPNGPESRMNINPPVDRSAGVVQLIYQDRSGLYGDDPTRRVELWEDVNGVATDAEIFAACPGLRDYVAMQIRAGGNTRLLAIASPYQPSERETWSIQMTEAEAWLVDNTRPTPMIDAICTGRGIDKATLISYIMANTNLFRQASGGILGLQQALLMEVYTASTVDALLAVAWP